MAAEYQIMDEDEPREEYVFVEEYFPLDLHEEEVVAEPLDAQEILVQAADHQEIVHGKLLKYQPRGPPQNSPHHKSLIWFPQNVTKSSPQPSNTTFETLFVTLHTLFVLQTKDFHSKIGFPVFITNMIEASKDG